MQSTLKSCLLSGARLPLPAQNPASTDPLNSVWMYLRISSEW